MSFQNRVGCECHPSDQAMKCPVCTLRHYMWSSGSWQVFHGVDLGVFSHRPADYCMMIAHLMSNSFEGNSCLLHADYLSSFNSIYQEVLNFFSLRIQQRTDKWKNRNSFLCLISWYLPHISHQWSFFYQALSLCEGWHFIYMTACLH